MGSFLLVFLKDCHRVVIETRDHLNHSAFNPSMVWVYNLVMRKIHLASKYLNILALDLNAESKMEIVNVKTSFNPCILLVEINAALS